MCRPHPYSSHKRNKVVGYHGVKMSRVNISSSEGQLLMWLLTCTMRWMVCSRWLPQTVVAFVQVLGIVAKAVPAIALILESHRMGVLFQKLLCVVVMLHVQFRKEEWAIVGLKVLQEKVFFRHSYIIFVHYEVLKTTSRATTLSLLMKCHHEKSRLLGSVGKK